MRRGRDFGIFWLVQTLSVAGDMFSLVAVPLLVLAATGSIAQMGLLTAASGVGRTDPPGPPRDTCRGCIAI
jgi:hypothetical protein